MPGVQKLELASALGRRKPRSLGGRRSDRPDGPDGPDGPTDRKLAFEDGVVVDLWLECSGLNLIEYRLMPVEVAADGTFRIEEELRRAQT
jgi:hypothetical protein